jgi:hypothetical protein
VTRFLRGRTRAPLAVAGFLAIPLFFCALMALSLAIERPHIVAGHEHSPTNAVEAKIWLLSLVAPAILVLVGVLAIAGGRHGIYVSAVAAIVLVLAITDRIDTWMKRHTLRFPLGRDLIGAGDPSGNKLDPGQWERSARDTALSLGHWTIGLAGAAVLIAALLEIRRVRRIASAPVGPPPEVADTVAVVPPSLEDHAAR